MLPTHNKEFRQEISAEPLLAQTAPAFPEKSDSVHSVSESTKLKLEEQDVESNPKTLEEEPSSTISRTSATSRKSTTGTGLRSLTVTETVLGYGSHGTVVLEGTFEGRKVAIKRMLADFYEVADHEVKMLQESDLHPNVVRYFFKEQTDGFTYIALVLFVI